MICRRRLLGIVAATSALAAIPATGSGVERRAYRWRGSALGATAHIDLYGADRRLADRLVRLCLAEIDRLEDIFSLQRARSALRRLEAEGRLDRPPLELVELLGLALRVAAWSDGAFDPTVQPLWQLWARHLEAPDADRAGPSWRAIDATRRLIGYPGVEVSTTSIRLAAPGMGLTLNGIAQGFIADRLTDILRAEACSEVLLDVGEIRTIGAGPGGLGWPIRAGHGGLALVPSDGAIATSAPSGGRLAPGSDHHHLLDPRTGRPARPTRAVSIVAPNATLADALSTALAIGGERLLPQLSAWPGVEVAWLADEPATVGDASGRPAWPEGTSFSDRGSGES